jgi:hypothetical protein
MEYPEDFAETIKFQNYLITVTNDSYLSATQLYKATALLHETIHAYMLSVVDDYDTQQMLLLMIFLNYLNDM